MFFANPALDVAARTGRTKLLLFEAFGGGFTWAPRRCDIGRLEVGFSRILLARISCESGTGRLRQTASSTRYARRHTCGSPARELPGTIVELLDLSECQHASRKGSSPAATDCAAIGDPANRSSLERNRAAQELNRPPLLRFQAAQSQLTMSTSALS
jgi:hypothetical protein